MCIWYKLFYKTTFSSLSRPCSPLEKHCSVGLVFRTRGPSRYTNPDVCIGVSSIHRKLRAKQL